MQNDVEPTLRELEDLLAGDNYQVAFSFYPLPYSPSWTVEQCIIAAVGLKPPLTKHGEVGLFDVLAEIEKYLRYDRGQYRRRDKSPQQTARFEELSTEVWLTLDQLANKSTSIIRFERDDPIEWQFSFLFIGADQAVVFIGWASD
jgi:hypothetical protein